MSVTVTEAGPFEKFVSFVVEEAELEAAKTQAARRLAKEVRIPGFRPGKAPRPIVEATVGKDRVRSEAIDDLLPQKVGQILDEIGVELAVTPSLESLIDIPEGIKVEVKVTMWPTLDEAPEIHDRAIEVGSAQISNDELEAQINRLRDQFGSLDEVDRPVENGDFVTLDISAAADGEPVSEASANDLVYEVGSGLFLDGVDEVLVGVEKGTTFSFDAPLPDGFGESGGRQVTFQITVSNIRIRVRPELTDEWVDEVTEFDTIEQMRSEMREQLGQMKVKVLANRFRELAIGQLVDAIDIEVPDAIVRSEMDDILHRFGHRLEQQGVEFADYLEVTGQSQEDFLADATAQAHRGVRTRLLLDAVVDQEGLEVTDDEIMAVVNAALARETEATLDAATFREALRGSPEEKSITSDILRNKALEKILSGARPVDEDGNEVDLTITEPDPEPFAGEVVEGEVVAGDVFEGEVVEGEILSEETEVFGAAASNEEE
ncbi:MAG TPA: trigger factor [Acidimicrobiia bacterium]|nr:trigger factor [Acidimicrobiia bacterium]